MLVSILFLVIGLQWFYFFMMQVKIARQEDDINNLIKQIGAREWDEWIKKTYPEETKDFSKESPLQ